MLHVCIELESKFVLRTTIKVSCIPQLGTLVTIDGLFGVWLQYCILLYHHPWYQRSGINQHRMMCCYILQYELFLNGYCTNKPASVDGKWLCSVHASVFFFQLFPLIVSVANVCRQLRIKYMYVGLMPLFYYATSITEQYYVVEYPLNKFNRLYMMLTRRCSRSYSKHLIRILHW